MRLLLLSLFYIKAMRFEVKEAHYSDMYGAEFRFTLVPTKLHAQLCDEISKEMMDHTRKYNYDLVCMPRIGKKVCMYVPSKSYKSSDDVKVLSKENGKSVVLMKFKKTSIDDVFDSLTQVAQVNELEASTYCIFQILLQAKVIAKFIANNEGTLDQAEIENGMQFCEFLIDHAISICYLNRQKIRLAQALRTFSFFVQKLNLVKHLAFDLTEDTSAKLDFMMQKMSLNVLMSDKSFGEWKFTDNLCMFELTHLPRHKPRPSTIKMLTKSGFRLPDDVIELIDAYAPQTMYQTVFVDNKPKIKKIEYHCPIPSAEIRQVGQASNAGREDVQGIIEQNKFMAQTILIDKKNISQHEWLSIFENIYGSVEAISEMGLTQNDLKALESFRDQVCSQIKERKELMFRSKMALLGKKLDFILAAHNPSHRLSSSWFALSFNIFLNRSFFFLIQIWRFFVCCFSAIIGWCID